MVTPLLPGSTRLQWIFRISTPVPASVVPGGFTFSQYLIRDTDPLLFHTGPQCCSERYARPSA